MSESNQATPLEPYNLYSSDPVLGDAVAREGGSASEDSSERDKGKLHYFLICFEDILCTTQNNE